MARRYSLPALIVLAVLAGCSTLAGGSGGSARPAPVQSPPATTASPPVRATVDGLFGEHPLFGVAVPQSDDAALDRIKQATMCRPVLVEVFVSVVDSMANNTLERLPVTPVLTLEPWLPGRGEVQPEVDLETTLGGALDDKYRAIARQIAGYRRPVLVRLAHEMNGHWYPWAMVGKNTPAQYVEMWKHVVSLFQQEGATNVLWVWSPNIPRGTDNLPLRSFYPGDEWVDIVGLTGYGVREKTPDDTLGAALRQIHNFTQKRILLSETGAAPDVYKTQWVAAFGRWLVRNPSVAGFIWFEKMPGSGAKADWRFDDTPARLAAFQTSLQEGKVSCT
ncbi:glycosyl hydrolase [Frankia sp. Cppng1_Ct_nod]|uniref:glycoside hydrolase family 26 protein n=1 Tax=Frankia sp. Cppng1_Ct_nod TaxID=2897162 RepID=UPI0013EFC42C|nr:glycosyl hydrolase [Frankia sp. Cppng1_Ct_nod]